ncbi:hypothetical protein O1611_g8587 [Lasiodiplodia mahajangana]|uniref:Uncharacterized protein n=1 Tax=Lasiodiplodia mahajangana TaxID=1108764 RepID=A0ACC2JCW2_9PEZI|nr:hypothetical protein O1611_g8587 [Lasiodiplodia mahajangana]
MFVQASIPVLLTLTSTTLRYDREIRSLVPRPVLAVILVFPTAPDYEARPATKTESDSVSRCKDVIWFKQTINNACGLYAILHAIANGRARDFIEPGSRLFRLLEKCASLDPTDCAAILENDTELDSKYSAVARMGDTEAPENAEDEVNFHYVRFAKSTPKGNLFILDGDRNGPVDKGLLPGDELFSEQGIQVLNEFIRDHDNGGHFSLLALSPDPNPKM